MDRDHAKKYTLFFGKYKGRTLDDIAASDEGLLYLDWLRGQRWFEGIPREAVEAYLRDITIQNEIVAAMERKHGR